MLHVLHLLKGHLLVLLTTFSMQFFRCGAAHSSLYVSPSEPQTGEETLLKEQLQVLQE